MIDIHDAMAQRADMVSSRNPDLIVRYSAYTDDRREWGILHILSEDQKVVGLEFFENEESWRRSNAVNDYDMAAHEGYPVAVLVPEGAFREFVDQAKRSARENFTVYSYSDFNIQPRMRTRT